MRALVNVARRASEKVKGRMIERAKDLGIEIPEWVPDRLRVEYADCAVTHGEETAASYVRRLKKELGL